MLYAKNAKRNGNLETIGFFVTFLPLVAFQFGDLEPPGPPFRLRVWLQLLYVLAWHPCNLKHCFKNEKNR